MFPVSARRDGVDRRARDAESGGDGDTRQTFGAELANQPDIRFREDVAAVTHWRMP